MPHLRPHWDPSETTLQSFPGKFLHQHQSSWALHDGCFASGQLHSLSQSEINFPIHCLVFDNFNILGVFLVILSPSDLGFDCHAIFDCRHVLTSWSYICLMLSNSLKVSTDIQPSLDRGDNARKKVGQFFFLCLSFFSNFWWLLVCQLNFPIFSLSSLFCPSFNRTWIVPNDIWVSFMDGKGIFSNECCLDRIGLKAFLLNEAHWFSI